MESHEDVPQVDLVANPELLQRALERSLADLTRYDHQVLLALVRLTDIVTAAREHVLVPEITATETIPQVEGGVVQGGLLGVIRRRLTRPHIYAPKAQVNYPSMESRDPTWRIVLGEAFEKGKHGKIVPVAYIDPWEDRLYDNSMSNPAPGIGWPSFEVRYMLEYVTGSPGRQESVEFLPDPFVHGTAFGDVRLRYGAHTYLSDESISMRKAFIDEQASKVDELVQAARDPNLNPDIAAEFARHGLEFEV